MRRYTISDLQFHFTHLECLTNLSVEVLIMQVQPAPLQRRSEPPFQINCCPTLIIYGSIVKLEHSFQVSERNNGIVSGNQLLILVISMRITFASRTPSNRLRNSKSRFLRFKSRSSIYYSITSLDLIIEKRLEANAKICRSRFDGAFSQMRFSTSRPLISSRASRYNIAKGFQVQIQVCAGV